MDYVKSWNLPKKNGISFIDAKLYDHTYPEHCHDEYVIAITYKGKSQFHSRKKTHIASKDTILVFNPGEPHSSITNKNSDWFYKGIYINRYFFRDVLNEMGNGYLNFNKFSNNLIESNKLNRAALNVFNKLSYNDKSNYDDDENIFDLINILSNGNKILKKNDDTQYDTVYVKKAIEFIKENYSYQDTSLDKICIFLDIPKHKLIRWFKKQTGVTPYRYLTSYRLLRSCQLIKENEDFIQISYKCGFYDQSMFNNHFKRSYMITPEDYKRLVIM